MTTACTADTSGTTDEGIKWEWEGRGHCKKVALELKHVPGLISYNHLHLSRVVAVQPDHHRGLILRTQKYKGTDLEIIAVKIRILKDSLNSFYFLLHMQKQVLNAATLREMEQCT